MTKLYIWIALIVSFGAAEITRHNSKRFESEKFLYPPPEHLEQFTFGFRESMADSFWLRWIQDSDNCQTYLKPIEKLEPNLDNKDDRLYSPRYKNCDNSWAFKMLDTVTKLAPKFKMPYLAGAISLSVLTEDYAGAGVIFERGLTAYPHDWSIAYRAAYHYLFDVKDLKKAAELLLIAGANGAPDWVRLLASRLYTQNGQLELGLTILENHRRVQTDEKVIESLDKRITELRTKLKTTQN